MNLTAEAHQEAKNRIAQETVRKTRTFVPPNTTYARSRMFTDGARTETSMIDATIALAAEAIASGAVKDVNILQLVEISEELGHKVSVARIRDHVAKNAFHAKHTKFTEDGDLLLSDVHKKVHA